MQLLLNVARLLQPTILEAHQTMLLCQMRLNEAVTPCECCYATLCRHGLGSDDGPRYGLHYGHATDWAVILSYPIMNLRRAPFG